MMHPPAHRDGHRADVMSVTSREFRRMEADRAVVLRIEALADHLEHSAFASFQAVAVQIREAVAGPQ